MSLLSTVLQKAESVLLFKNLNNYIPEKTSFLITAMLSMGAVAIDVDGIVDVICEE